MVKQLLKLKAFLLLVVMCMATSAAHAYDNYLHFQYSYSVSATPTGAGLVYAQIYEVGNQPSPEEFQPNDDEYAESASETDYLSVGYDDGDPVPTECPAVLDLWAKANPGYRFDGWALADTPDVIVSTNQLYEVYPTLTSTDDTNPHVFNYIAKFTYIHVHSWATEWTQAEEGHYHACTAEDCDITDYTTAPAEAAYAAHGYGSDISEISYFTCTTCGYEDATLKDEYCTAAAQPVIDLINAIGDVDEFSNKAITAARNAYDALIEDAKAYVTNYDDLLKAEAKYREILDFYKYRNIRALGLGWIVGPLDRAEVGDLAAEAVQKLTVLRYQPELTLDQNKDNVDEIYEAYMKVIIQKRGDLAHATIFADAKEKAKLNIMLFLGISDSQSARDAAEAGKAAIDALEYDDETDILNNIEEIQDIVIDTKVNIVKAWMADFEDFKDVIRNIIGINPQLESIKYDKELTYNENIAKLEAVREAAAGSATSIESIGADSAKPMKYIENGKLVIVKNGSKYAANGAIIK